MRGEAELAVDPLGLPGQEEEARRATCVGASAARAGPGGLARLGDAEGDRASIEAACVRLAGVPLALELAAARARLLDPATLLDRLDDAVEAGARDLPERQRTMRATLNWSYGLLCSPTGRRCCGCFSLLWRLRLDDLESVAASHDGWSTDPLALLASLSEHSLVTADAGAVPSRRFRVLEPVGQYARDRLLEAGEEKTAYAAHLDHYLGLSERAAPHYQDGEQVEWLARIEPSAPT